MKNQDLKNIIKIYSSDVKVKKKSRSDRKVSFVYCELQSAI